MLLANSAFRESGLDLTEIEAGYTEKLEKRFLKKETVIYHFDVYLKNYFILVQEGRKHLQRGHYDSNILTNKVPSVFFNIFNI